MNTSKDFLIQINLEYKKTHGKDIEPDLARAYDFAKMAYYKEKRLSKRSILNHALNASLISAKVGADKTTVIAAILHDVYLYGASYSEVCDFASQDVADLLNNYLHIRNLREKYKNINAESQVYNEYIRRLILTFASDIRAVIVRLAEKVDSLSDVEYLPNEKQKVIFENTHKIYAPLAELIGLYALKQQLEETAFLKEKPKAYKKYSKILNSHKVSNQANFDRFYKKLLSELSLSKVDFVEVKGRVKNPYSFYKKVKKYEKSKKISNYEAANKVLDKVAYHIVCKSVEDCYKALDVIHTKYQFVQQEFDDYIKSPKPNGYKAIHTIVDVNTKTYVEVQIKTLEMHQFNEYGPASHTYYKMYGSSKQVDEKKVETIKNLVGWKDNLLKNKGFSTDQIHSTILTITPHGDVIELQKGSTPIDFAYKVHSKIGDKATGAFVNDKHVALDYNLSDGDVVNIITKANAEPNYKWLEFVATKDAKIHIKRKLKKLGKI
jgi:RelA/SpoT family (p)ppGpp synthetase